MTVDKRLLGRRGARYGAVQGIYRWLMNEACIADLVSETADWGHLKNADMDYFEVLLRGVVADAARLDAVIDPKLDRPLVQLDPMEHAILLVSAWELANCPELAVRIVIDEAVELAKVFGATDGHRFINGVSDKIARELRPNDPQPG